MFAAIPFQLDGLGQSAWNLLVTLVAELHLTFLPHLLAALILGFLIGVERRSRHKAIGVRTYMVMAGSAAMIAYFGLMISQSVSGADPTRLAGQVLSGITWIGLAITVTRRGNFAAAGVTTAAMMVLSVAAGLGCGLGLYGPSIVGTLLVLLAVMLSRKFMKSSEWSPPVLVVCKADRRDEVLDLFGHNRCVTSFKRLADDNIEFVVQPVISPHDCEQLIERLVDLEYVSVAQLDSDH